MTPTPNHLGPYLGARIVVLGASGFIGRWVARHLAPTGARTWLAVREFATGRPTLDRYGAHGEIVPLDLGREADLEHLLAEVRPAVVFNLAGYGIDRGERDPSLARALNEDVPRRLAETLPRRRDPAWTGLALVHAGSALEYGAVGGDLREETPPAPTTDYGRTKLAGTRWVVGAAERGLPGTVARIFTAYGPGEHPGRLLPTLLAGRKSSERIAFSAGDQTRDFTFVGDVTEGMVRLGCSEARVPPVLNLATGVLTPVRHFIEIGASALGIAPERLGFGDLPQLAEEMSHQPVAVARLERTLEWRPTVAPREGIDRTAALLDSMDG